MASFDVDALIQEVSVEEPIWNIKSNDYHDRVKKYASWTKVAKAVINNFEALNDVEKQTNVLALQKKWKNLTDTFRRKCVTKSGQAANKKKKYMYSDIMEFLRPTMENIRTESNFDGDVDDDDDDNDDDNLSIEDKKADIEKNKQNKNNEFTVTETLEKLKRKSKKNSNKKNMSDFECELINLLEKKKAPRISAEEDPDKLFLLSLVPNFKTLPEDLKTDCKIQILNIIKNLKHQHSLHSHAHHSPLQNYNQTLLSHSAHSSQPSYSHHYHNPPLQIPAFNIHSFQSQVSPQQIASTSQDQPTNSYSNFTNI